MGIKSQTGYIDGSNVPLFCYNIVIHKPGQIVACYYQVISNIYNTETAAYDTSTEWQIIHPDIAQTIDTNGTICSTIFFHITAADVKDIGNWKVWYVDTLPQQPINTIPEITGKLSADFKFSDTV